jgi:PIN domain nuclease of toxin-antitoxin system
MNEYVTDTHALLWHILSSSKLSLAAALIFKQTDENEARIYIPTIVLVEIVYLIEKAKVPKFAIDTVIGLLETQPTNYCLAHLELSTIRVMQTLSRQLIPEMPDRIITATALEFGLPLITKDSKITAAKVVQVIW